MKLPFLIIKNLITYTLAIFIIYLVAVNITLNPDKIFDVFIKSISLAILLVPLSLINYFSPYVARNGKYHKEIKFNKPIDESFKASRSLLKTMTDINMTDSNRETNSFELQSEYSIIQIKMNAIKDNHTQLIIESTPKVYAHIQDFDKYIKDVHNVLTTLRLHLEPEKYENVDFEELKTPEDYRQEFKARLVLYYRLIKIWFIFSLTLLILFTLYYFAINLSPGVSTFVFFSIIFLYIFYLFTNEVTQSAEYITCPSCGKRFIQHPFDVRHYNVPVQCNQCQTTLLPQKQTQQ
jgi:hypothetical protein